VVPGIYPVASSGTNSSVYFKSPFFSYNEVYAEDATSVGEYGVRMAAVYEGSTLGIDTETEATRLANTILSDLAQPQADIQITSRVSPLELNDYVKLPTDVKTRYEESHRVMTVTGYEERYASGTSEANYKLRVGLKPTRGRVYVNRMLTGDGAPAPSINISQTPFMISDRLPYQDIKLDQAGMIRMQINSINPSTAGAKPLMREDKTQVWVSNSSSGFIPTKANLSASVRGKNLDVKATPGQAQYIKIAVADKFGNISSINGVGMASVATVYSVTPRFTNLSAGALLFPSIATTERNYSSSTYTPIFMGASSTSFSSRGYDVYSNFIQASLLFQMPCDGVVSVDAEFDARVNTTTGIMLTRVNKLRLIGGALVSFGSTAPTNETLSNTTYGATSRKAYSFIISASSGDYLRYEVADVTGGKTFSV
jgi:hypothetical protein